MREVGNSIAPASASTIPDSSMSLGLGIEVARSSAVQSEKLRWALLDVGSGTVSRGSS